MMRAERAAQPAAVTAETSRAICRLLLSSEAMKQAAVILAYASKEHEVSTTALLEALLAEQGKRVAVPRVTDPAALKMEACVISSLDQLRPGHYHVLEPDFGPDHGEVIEPSAIDLVLVPGLAFDKGGHRIGYGKGYFDSFLKKTSCIRVGLCFAFQLLDAVPHDGHDVKMHLIVTEEGIVDCRH